MKDTTKKIVTEKAEYDMKLRKKLEKKQFNTDLSKEEYETLNNLLKEKGLSKVLFIRLAKEELENNNLKISSFDNIKAFLSNKRINIDIEKEKEFRFYIHKNKIEDTIIKINNTELRYKINSNNTFAFIEIINYDINSKCDKYHEGFYDIDTLNKLLNIIKNNK